MVGYIKDMQHLFIWCILYFGVDFAGVNGKETVRYIFIFSNGAIKTLVDETHYSWTVICHYDVTVGSDVLVVKVPD